ncbi:MAG: AraC family transcriptional regulator, partial [Prevotella sp.]
MTEAKGINALSMESINIDELMQQPEQGRLTMNDEIVLVIGGHLQDTRFLEEGKIYQMVEPRLVLAMQGHADI